MTRTADADPMNGNQVVDALSRAECEELLAHARVGRVILTEAAMPTAVPVAYVLADGDVVFRGGARLALSKASSGTVVAFEIDAFDESSRTGWTVLATGLASFVVDFADVARLDARSIPSWVDSHHTRYVRLRVGLMSGRRVRPERPFA